MGWSKRGSDSLNGYGAIIEGQTGKIIDWGTKNRVCKKCELGHDKTNHNRRQNFNGSSKAMEADLGVDLMARNSILKEYNLEVGVFVGDNDCATLSGLKAACSHEPIKFADKNHTSKGVLSMLYKLDRKDDPDHELNSGVIKYFHDCFAYAMAQNKGDSKKIAAAVRNITFHAHNIHDNCGSWCRYKQDPVNHVHSTIGDGIISPILFNKLRTLFGRLANNAKEYFACASSNGNESFHSSVTRFCPKSFCYSQSADMRVACAVVNKNEGERYLQQVADTLTVKSSQCPRKYTEKKAKIKEHTIKYQSTYAFRKKKKWKLNKKEHSYDTENHK